MSGLGKTTVAVSGANGFVGRALLRTLADQPDLQAIPITRANGPDLVEADASDWEKALAGADCYVHLAARLPWSGANASKRALPEFLAANTEGARRAFQGFANAGGRHFVFMSTIGVNGVVPREGAFRETDRPAPAGNYSTSKHLAEMALGEFAELPGAPRLTILRPPIVYGAGVTGSFGNMVSKVRAGIPLPLGGVDNSRDMIGVRNLCDIIAAVIREGVTGVFLVRDRDPVSSEDLVRMIANACGVQPRLFAVPRVMREAAVRFPFIGPKALRLFSDVRIDDTALRTACSWAPRFTVEQEIEAMIGEPVS